MKDWEKVIEWFEENEENFDEENEINWEEKKRREKRRNFSEFFFGGDGWHITTRP